MDTSPDILDSSVTAWHPGVTLQGPDHFLADVEVVGVLRCSVKQVSGLNELRPEKMLAPVHLSKKEIISN